MRDEYDFSSGVKNPYTRQQKTTVTIRLDKTTVEYFKSLSEEAQKAGSGVDGIAKTGGSHPPPMRL